MAGPEISLRLRTLLTSLSLLESSQVPFRWCFFDLECWAFLLWFDLRILNFRTVLFMFQKGSRNGAHVSEDMVGGVVLIHIQYI